MKALKIVSLSFFAFLTFSNLIGQTSGSKEIDANLFQKWEFQHYQFMGQIMEEPEQKGDYMIFEKDKPVLVSAGGDETTGDWEYDSASKTIFMTPVVTKKRIGMKILELTSDKLILEVNERDYKMEIHWKSAK